MSKDASNSLSNAPSTVCKSAVPHRHAKQHTLSHGFEKQRPNARTDMQHSRVTADRISPHRILNHRRQPANHTGAPSSHSPASEALANAHFSQETSNALVQQLAGSVEDVVVAHVPLLLEQLHKQRAEALGDRHPDARHGFPPKTKPRVRCKNTSQNRQRYS